MARSVYIAGLEPDSGKSAVALGVVETIARRVSNVGVFRPVIPTVDAPDDVLALLRRRYRIDVPQEDCYGVTYADARTFAATGRIDEMIGTILEKFHRLDSQCDIVVCVGSDFADVSVATEFEFNARLATNFGAPVICVVSGHDRSADEVVAATRVARQTLGEMDVTLVAVVANRVDPSQVDQVVDTLERDGGAGASYVLPENAALLDPTVGELAGAIHADLMFGDPAGLERQAKNVVVGAMTLPTFLGRLVDEALVITPGDRSDLLIGTLAAHASAALPTVAGVILTGDLIPDVHVRRLLDGLASPVPVLAVDSDTYSTARAVNRVQGRITPENERKIAAALGTFESHVDVEELAERIELTKSEVVTPLMFEYELLERARANRRHIVLPEGEDDRILRATEQLLRRGVVEVTVLGHPDSLLKRAAELGVSLVGATILDPTTSDLVERFAAKYAELRAHKGVTLGQARDVVVDVSYFATMMVAEGLVDGMVSGAIHTTAHTIRPAFEIIRTRPGVAVVSSVFFMCLPDRVLVYGDCAVNPDPDAVQLADIAISSAQTAQQFGVEPRVAMLSYSTGESGRGADVEKVREATRLVRDRRPDLKVEGPIQYDAAVDVSVAQSKLPGSDVAGQATIFIFPDLNTGNNTYKAVQRSAGAVAIGPVLQGLNKPVNDLSRGCTIPDIVNTVAITAIQAQES